MISATVGAPAQAVRASVPGMQTSRRNASRGITGYSRSETLDLHEPVSDGDVEDESTELQRLEEQRAQVIKSDQPAENLTRGIDTARGLQQIAPAGKSKLPRASPGETTLQALCCLFSTCQPASEQ